MVDGLVVRRDGATQHEEGDPARPVLIRSVRKSILSLLFGIEVERGAVRLADTLGELGINDREPLSETELSATVEDLLMSRSGITHLAAAETEAMKATRPARDAHGPGERFWYNNWDFNALGTIYERVSGRTVFEGFRDELAGPLGLKDVTSDADRTWREDVSVHAAYHLAVSARDLAAVGDLVLADGAGLVSPDWIARSTSPLTPVADYGLGYGYLWWVGDLNGHHCVLALGGGSFLAIVPSLRLSVAHTQCDRTPGWWLTGGRSVLQEAIARL